jgi:tellurite resistance protein
VLILVVFRNWIVHPMQFDHIHPGWFILMVGIVVGVPPGVALGHHELSWACLAAGILAAVTLYPIILFRLFFYAPLPPALRPILFILIAPPALIFSAYVSLNRGQLDAFAHDLFFAGGFSPSWSCRCPACYFDCRLPCPGGPIRFRSMP